MLRASSLILLLVGAILLGAALGYAFVGAGLIPDLSSRPSIGASGS
jgi:hypothetical protein